MDAGTWHPLPSRAVAGLASNTSLSNIAVLIVLQINDLSEQFRFTEKLSHEH